MQTSLFTPQPRCDDGSFYLNAAQKLSSMFRSALIFALASGAAAVAIDVKKAPRTVMEPDVTIFEAPRWARGERVSGDEPVALTFFLKHCPYQSVCA